MINIDKLTLREIKNIQSLLGNTNTNTGTQTLDTEFIGQKVIIRTYSAGVHFGTLSKKAGNEVILINSRRLWRWKAKESISLSALAQKGLAPTGNEFAPTLPSIWLEAIEIIPCSSMAIEEIENEKDKQQ